MIEVCYFCRSLPPTKDFIMENDRRIVRLSICQNCAADIEANYEEIMALVRSNIFWGKSLFLTLMEKVINGLLAKIGKNDRIGYKPRCSAWYAWQMIRAFTR